MNLSIKNVFDSYPISTVFKNENGQIGFQVVKVLVVRFMESFGFATKMNESQIETITVDVLDHFRCESIEDILLFFKMARTGLFGATSRGVDSNLIFGDWFPKYMMLKAEEREKQYMKQKKEQIKPEITIEEVRRSYEKHNASMLQQVVNYVDKITDGMTRNQLEDLIVEWRADAEKSKYIRVLLNKRNFIK